MQQVYACVYIILSAVSTRHSPPTHHKYGIPIMPSHMRLFCLLSPNCRSFLFYFNQFITTCLLSAATMWILSQFHKICPLKSAQDINPIQLIPLLAWEHNTLISEENCQSRILPTCCIITNASHRLVILIINRLQNVLYVSCPNLQLINTISIKVQLMKS